jgi:predicted DsbA family dithiol-disulfide isomerase
MKTVQIEIDALQEQLLSEVARREGKSLHELIEELFDSYLTEKENTFQMMRLSENSFSDWDNEEDAVYDCL